MKNYIISEGKFEELVKELNTPYCFEVDGCDCGEFNFLLEADIYISITRSCRKSSGTPDGMKWKLHEVNITEEILDEDKWEKYNISETFILDENQRKQIKMLAMTRSVKDIGYDEYGNEVIFEEPAKLDKWDELKQYLLIEKEKIHNTDDIPRYIFDDILFKIEELEDK